MSLELTEELRIMTMKSDAKFEEELSCRFKIDKKNLTIFFFFFFNSYSLQARLNSHYEAWSYKKRKHKKVKAYRKSI